LVAPFQGERFADVERLSRVIAPPYDVIDTGERTQLAALDEHNIVHVMLPEAPEGRSPDARYAVAAELLARVLADFCANADRKMIGARKRPQVALELFQEFHFDDVFFGGHEIAERHFEVSCA